MDIVNKYVISVIDKTDKIFIAVFNCLCKRSVYVIESYVISVIDKTDKIFIAVFNCIRKRSGYVIESTDEYYAMFSKEANKFVTKNFQVKYDSYKSLIKSAEEFVIKTYNMLLEICFRNEMIIVDCCNKIKAKCFVEATKLCILSNRISKCPSCELNLDKNSDDYSLLRSRIKYSLKHLDIYDHVISRKRRILKMFVTKIDNDLKLKDLEFEKKIRIEAERKEKLFMGIKNE